MAAPQSSSRVLVYGGAGALGRAVVSAFKASGSVVESVDFVQNQEADVNRTINSDFEASLTSVVTALDEEVKIGGGQKLYDAVVCVAGGWTGGALTGETVDLIASVQKMLSMNVQSALASAHLTAKYLKDGGFAVFTGANPARKGTEGMIGYGMSKAATHQLAQSLHLQLVASSPTSSVLTILPITLDTPSNRAGMPNADFSSWTPCNEVAQSIHHWTSVPSSRPASGSMLLVETKNNVTAWTPVKTDY